MNSRQLYDFLTNKFLNKEIVITCDLQGGNSDMFIGLTGLVTEIREGNITSIVRVVFPDGRMSQFYIGELELQAPQKAEPQVPEEVKIEFAKRTIEDVDEFGNTYIVQLLPPDEKFIYLSSALRTLLNIKDGDFINFAFDKNSKSYFICKETDSSNGYQVIANKIESTAEWRNLYNTFNHEKVKSNEAKLKFHVSHYEKEQDEYPEYKLFLINEPWVELKKKEDKKVKETTKKESFTYGWKDLASRDEEMVIDENAYIRNVAVENTADFYEIHQNIPSDFSEMVGLRKKG